jgi:hypothetical protein
MTKLFVSGTEGRAYQEFRGRDLNALATSLGVSDPGLISWVNLLGLISVGVESIRN